MGNYNYVVSNGTIIPETSEVIADVENEFKSIFGDDLVTDPETPEGALIAAEVTSRQSVIRNNAKVANQLNPTLSGGTFFDSIWALTGGGRVKSTRSTVQAVVTGVSGTTITQGALAVDDDGNEWEAVSDIFIGTGGQATGSFRATEFGPITLGIGELNTIADNSILGWETITNDVAAVPGRNTQNDVEARRDRRNQLALQGRSTAVAVTSNLAATEGVRSWAFRENVENTTQVIDGITLAPHSIWAAVDGGADSDVAEALLEAKSSGSNWNGDITIQVVEQASGQSFPVKFVRPESIGVRIRITASMGMGTDPSNSIIDAVLAYASGQSAIGRGFVTGQDVSPYEISAAINESLPSVYISNLELAVDDVSPTYQNSPIAIALDEIATIERANIEVIFA